MDKELKQKILALFDDEELEVIEEGDWVSDHKYETREDVVKFEDKFYSVISTRSGSYFTEYEYLDTEVYEVVPKQVTVTKWVAV